MSFAVDTFRGFVEGDRKMRDIMMACTQALFVRIALLLSPELRMNQRTAGPSGTGGPGSAPIGIARAIAGSSGGPCAGEARLAGAPTFAVPEGRPVTDVPVSRSPWGGSAGGRSTPKGRGRVAVAKSIPSMTDCVKAVAGIHLLHQESKRAGPKTGPLTRALLVRLFRDVHQEVARQRSVNVNPDRPASDSGEAAGV